MEKGPVISEGIGIVATAIEVAWKAAEVFTDTVIPEELKPDSEKGSSEPTIIVVPARENTPKHTVTEKDQITAVRAKLQNMSTEVPHVPAHPAPTTFPTVSA